MLKYLAISVWLFCGVAMKLLKLWWRAKCKIWTMHSHPTHIYRELANSRWTEWRQFWNCSGWNFFWGLM